MDEHIELTDRERGVVLTPRRSTDTGDMIARMATPASKTPGSVGTVETQFLDLPKPLRLDCGLELHPIRIAYETYGTLSPARDNVVLVCHALSGDAHAAGFARTPPAESTRDGFAAEDRDGASRKGLGWWDGMIGPGKAFDTDRFFVVSTNLLGGCRGTTGPSSINPATGRPYGSDFPVITVRDMVRTERAGDAVDADRTRNVLDHLLAHVLETEAELIAYLVVDVARHKDATWFGKRLQPGRHINAVTVDVVIVADNVTDIDADAKFDTPVRRHINIALEHAALNFNGAAHSVDDADEFHQHAISGRLNDMAAVLGDFGINQILTMRL